MPNPGWSFSLRGLLVALTLSAMALAAERGANAAFHAGVGMGSAWWGPFYFVNSGPQELLVIGWLLNVGCLTANVLSFRFLPLDYAILVAALTVLVWLYFGAVGSAIGC